VGVPPVSSEDIPSRVAVLGAAYQGTLAARFRVQTGPILTDHVAGPLVRSSRHLLSSTRIPLITARCEASNPGAYDTLDTSGMTGTAEPAVDALVVPRDEYEAYWIAVTGGDIGTAGITYYESTDGGRTLSGLKKLGTGAALTFATEGITINLNPPVAELAAYVDDLRLMTVDHFAEIAASVHGAADATSGTGIPGTTVSTLALARTCMIALKAAALLHVVNLASSIHGAADTTAQTALNAITISSSSTGQQVLAAALAYKAAMFGTGTANSGHTIRITGSIHGAADAANVITAATPTTGTLDAGDIIRAQTFAPSPSVDELAAAFSVLALSDYTPGVVLLPGRTPASYGPTITAGLDLLKTNGKPCQVIVQARRATSGESQQDLRDALETEWDDTDKRIHVCATDALCTLTEGSATLAVGKTRFTGFASSFAVRRVLNPFYETTWKVQPALEGVTIVDSAGDVVGHDEPRDVPTRLQLLYRVPDSQIGRPTVPSIDYTLAGDEDREITQRANLIRDEIERVINSWAWSQVGVLASVTVLSPTQGRLNEGRRQDLQRNAAAALASRPGLANGVSDIDASDLVVIDPLVALNGDIITIAPVVNWTPIGAIGRIDSTISARVGS